MSTGGILGRTLAGRFRVTGFIGEGAMASVYRGVQEAEPHDVALKIMHPQLVSDATFVGRFRREAKAASRIVHPNVVKIVDTGVDGDLLYIAMELLRGQDLFETLVVERRLAEARAARILFEVTDALVAAHERGVVHRDLKPENIMLLHDPDDPSREEVKVLDFGIAKLLDWDTPSMDSLGGSLQSTLTGVGTVVGTPAYMSPEQCRGEPVDVRSDVYTCGILLYQLVAGRLPFASDNAMDLAVMHVRTPPTPLESVVPAVHPRLAALIMTALAKWPSQRQQTAAALRDGLRALLPDLSPSRLALAGGAEPRPLPAPVAAPAVQQAITLPPPTPAVTDAGEQTAMPEAVVDDGGAETPPNPPGAPSRSSEAKATSSEVKTPAAKPEAAPRREAPAAPPAGAKPAPAVKRVPRAPAAAPLAVRREGKAQRRRRAGAGSWWLVPLALLLGVGIGALAFLIARR